MTHLAQTIIREIATIYNGMNLFLEKEDWIPFVEKSAFEIAIILLYLASHVNLKKFKKHKRGPKKSPVQKNKFIAENSEKLYCSGYT